MGRSAASRETVFNRIDQLLNYDFCPWANQWVYWMKHPLVGISVAAVSAGLCSLYVSPQAWLFCAGLLLVGLLGLAWPLIALAAIQVQIRFEQAWCEEGTPVRVKVKITNRLPCPVWGLSLLSVRLGIDDLQAENVIQDVLDNVPVPVLPH